MASRRGEARLHVAALRTAALGGSSEAARPQLTRFAGALDGAHAESSRVAHDLARVLAVLLATEGAGSGVYLPDLQMNRDPRFARAVTPVPFPVDPDLEHFSPDRAVDDGPLHAFAREAALALSASLEKMLGSVREAAQAYPVAYAGCDGAEPAGVPSGP